MSPPDPQHVEQLRQQLLQQSEFAQLERAPSTEVQQLGELFTSMFAAVQAWLSALQGNNPGLLVLIVILALAVAFAGALWMLRGYRRQQTDSAQVAERPRLLQGDPEDLRRRAAEAAAQGAYLEATRLEFRAGVIEQALREGVLQDAERASVFRRARTYRELVTEFAREGARKELLQSVAARLEEGMYGGAPIVDQDYVRAQELRA